MSAFPDYSHRIAQRLCMQGMAITPAAVLEVERELERERKGETLTAQIGQEAAATRSMDGDAVHAALLGKGLRVRLGPAPYDAIDPGGCAPPVLASKRHEHRRFSSDDTGQGEGR